MAAAQALPHQPVPAPGEEVRIPEADDVGKQVVEGGVAPLLQERGRNPGSALPPARDRRGIQQVLAQRDRGVVEVRHARHVVGAELLEHRHHVHDRALDVGAVAGRAVEVAGEEHGRQQRPQLVAVVPQDGAELGLQRRRRILADEEAVDLGCNVLGRDGLLQDDFEHVHAVEAPGAAQEGLGSVVVLRFVDHEVQVLEIPAGEGARRLADVALRIVAHAHREQLHHLAGEVLVGGPLHVHPGIEVVEHPRILRDRDQQLAEVPGRVTLEHLDLEQHLAVVADLALGGGEVPVPEQRHLFFERPAGVEHPLGPPVADAAGLQRGRAQPVEEAIGDRLYVAVDMLGLDAHAHALAALDRQVGGGRPARREGDQRLVPEARMHEGLQVVVRDVVVVHEGTDGLLGSHVGQLPDLLRRAGETGSAQQMRGAVVAPVRRGDRGQIARPRGRAR